MSEQSNLSIYEMDFVIWSSAIAVPLESLSRPVYDD